MKYIPALRYDFLTPFYDGFISFFIAEKRIKKKVIAFTEISENDRVLDFGCGTGTLCRMISEVPVKIELVGVDTDMKILEIAKRKKVGNFELVQYNGETLPFENDSFDKIIVTWVFHHLAIDQKIQAINEIHRTLKPGGKLVIADWGKPIGLVQKTLFTIVQLVDNFKTFKLHRKGQFPDLIKSKGFPDLKELGHEKTIFGTLYYWSSIK